MKIYGGYLECDHERRCKHIIWTGTLTNERVLQSLIGGRKRVFVDCSKATAEEVVNRYVAV